MRQRQKLFFDSFQPSKAEDQTNLPHAGPLFLVTSVMLENFCNENMQGGGSPSHSCASFAEQNHKYKCGAGTSQEQLCGRVNKAKGWLAASDCLSFLTASSLHLCYLNGSFCVWFVGISPLHFGGGVCGEERAHKALVWESPDTCTCLGCQSTPGTGQAALGIMAGECSEPLRSRCEGSFVGFVRYMNELFIYTAGLGPVQRGKSLLTKKA